MNDSSKSERSLEKSERPLDGLVVGISVSESENLSEWGYTSADVNRATVRLSEALLATGARLMFGHDWRPDGIMDAICRLALKFQPAENQGPSKPLIHNLLPWPNKSSMDQSLRAELEQRGVLKIETMAAPQGEWQSPTDDTAKALALTELRQRLAKDCDARVCIGGKEAKLKTDTIGGFYSGVIEEAYYTAKQGKAVYFANFLGGACGSLVTYLKGQDSDKAEVRHIFGVVPSKHEQFQACKTRSIASSGTRTTRSVRQPGDTLQEDLKEGFNDHELQKHSGLSDEDWDALLEAPDTEAFVTLVIRGLREVAKRKPRSHPQPNSGPVLESVPIQEDVQKSGPGASAGASKRTKKKGIKTTDSAPAPARTKRTRRRK